MSPYETASRLAQQGYSADEIRALLIKEAEEAAERIRVWIESYERRQAQQEDGR